MKITVHCCNINYEIMGENNHTPVILLHGWLTDLETMRPLALNLQKHFKVYLVDVPGFGKSDIPEHPWNSDDFGDFLKSFISQAGIHDRPILIGHSNGGRIIINAVRKRFSKT